MKKSLNFVKNRKCAGRIALITFLLVLGSFAFAEDQPPAGGTHKDKEWVRIIAPAENSEVVGKKPEIKAEFLEPVDKDTLLVLLDGADITQLLDLTEKGFGYSPFLVLPPGMHSLSVSASDKGGVQLQKQITFSTRHTNTFNEAYTTNEASVTYETILTNPDEVPYAPDSKVEGNLKSDTKLNRDGLEFTFNTNVRYFDQNRPSPESLKGLDVANWFFRGSYAKDALKLQTSIGDVQVNETPYTVYSLARKGGILTFQYDTVEISTFSVQSQQFFGLKGIGIEGTTEDHILGISGGVQLFSNRLKFKTVYATGGEPQGSFGISTTQGAKTGDVIGFVLSSDFFENKLRTEFEAGFSEYDPDTSDEFSSNSDKAYKIKLGGTLDKYTYEAAYEFIGRDYAVVGNQMLQKDKQGVTIMNGLNLGAHIFSLNLSGYNDNVRNDELFPRIYNTMAVFDYLFYKIPNLPMGINYQRSMQKSSREPSDAYELDLRTDTVSGRINYMIEKFSIGLQTAYSLQNDRTGADNDTNTFTVTLSPSYTIPNVSVATAFSFNQSQFPKQNLSTDTYTINLDLRTKFFRERGSFDVGGTYNIIKANNGSADNQTLNSSFRLAYLVKNFLKGYVNPMIALRGSYLRVIDDIYTGSNKEEYILMLVLGTSLQYAF
jgi:hypothetical protein